MLVGGEVRRLAKINQRLHDRVPLELWGNLLKICGQLVSQIRCVYQFQNGLGYTGRITRGDQAGQVVIG